MAYQIQWLVENQLIFAALSGDMNIDPTEFDMEVTAMLDSSDATWVHYIGEVTHVERAPSLAIVRKLKFLKHPRIGFTVSVDQKSNRLGKMIANLTAQFADARHRQYDQLGDALQFLISIDDALPKVINIPQD